MSHQLPELLPCPLCGTEAEIYNPFHLMGNPSAAATYRGGVRCKKCGCQCNATTPPDEAIAKWNTRAIASVKREPLSDEQIDQIHGHAYIALRAQGFNGGMGGLTWDRASARAIEQAHGIGATIKDSLTTDSGEGE